MFCKSGMPGHDVSSLRGKKDDKTAFHEEGIWISRFTGRALRAIKYWSLP